VSITLSDHRRAVLLRQLEDIGGWVRDTEVAYQFGDQAILDLHEAAEDGLVEVRVEFTLTAEGEAALGGDDA